MAKKKIKRKLNIKALIVCILIIYLFCMVIYYFLSMPIKNIYITGTTNLSDNEIIHAAGIKNYPSIIKLNSSKMKKNIKKLNYVDDVKIKRNVFGKLTIDIKEANILFYNIPKFYIISFRIYIVMKKGELICIE